MHYLDHAATTPLRASAREAWLAVVDQGARSANPSSIHAAGRRARSVVDDARERVAAALGAHPTEVIFTSGATEANNLALASSTGPIVTTAVEHHSVLDAATSHGAIIVGVDSVGVVDVEAIQLELPRTGLLSVQFVNNETGTVQPLGEVLAIARAAQVPVHSDAVQAVGHLPVDFADSGLAMMSVSAHKLGGRLRRRVACPTRRQALAPCLRRRATAGKKWHARRGGGCAFAAALDEAVGEIEAETVRLAGLKDRLRSGILAAIPDAEIVGGAGTSPHILNAIFPGAGRRHSSLPSTSGASHASSGSACTAGVVDASHVLLAMGRTPAEASSALRVSVGHTSSDGDVDAFLAALPAAVAGARAAVG